MLSCYKSFLDCVWSPFRLQLSHFMPQDYRHFWCRCNSGMTVKGFPALGAILGMSHFSCLVVNILNKSPKDTKFSFALQSFYWEIILLHTYAYIWHPFLRAVLFLPQNVYNKDSLLTLIQLSPYILALNGMY